MNHNHHNPDSKLKFPTAIDLHKLLVGKHSAISSLNTYTLEKVRQRAAMLEAEGKEKVLR
ncbi:hypothetical protein [Okeania sp. SIO3B5]|uniref:hypothetical protein n=1 Tax=Okeania sp. SIO3B5 TaxID=2607811 RepID=UPI0025CC3DE8|nr:hypothetical protein [Okeania sp. SIO3B5]